MHGWHGIISEPWLDEHNSYNQASKFGTGFLGAFCNIGLMFGIARWIQPSTNLTWGLPNSCRHGQRLHTEVNLILYKHSSQQTHLQDYSSAADRVNVTLSPTPNGQLRSFWFIYLFIWLALLCSDWDMLRGVTLKEACNASVSVLWKERCSLSNWVMPSILF